MNTLTQALSRAKYLGARRLGPKLYWYLMGTLRPVPAVTSSCSTLAESLASGEQVVALLDRLGVLHPDAVTLHVGSGLGRVELHLRTRVQKCYGIDISRSMVKRAAEQVPGVDFRVTDGNGITAWPAGFFDLVYSFLVFQHVPRPTFDKYVRDAHRVLAPDGHFVFHLLIDDTGSKPEPPRNHPYGIRYYRRAEVERVLSDAGFTGARRTWLDGTPDDGSIAAADVVFCARASR